MGAVVPGSIQDFVVNIGDRVYFDFDQYDIRADAGPVLDAQSQWLMRYPSVQVRIEGNADERGTREYNLALGARRANSVREYLVSRGVSPARISTVSFGTPYGYVEINDQRQPVPVDEVMLKKIAELSDGNHYSAASLEQLKEVFSSLQDQIGYETVKGDASVGWLRLGALTLALAALAALLINRRLPG